MWCAEWEAHALLNHVLFAARSVFVAYVFGVAEHKGTARFARSLELVLIPVQSLDHTLELWIKPHFHTLVISRLRDCFHTRTSLE